MSLQHRNSFDLTCGAVRARGAGFLALGRTVAPDDDPYRSSARPVSGRILVGPSFVLLSAATAGRDLAKRVYVGFAPGPGPLIPKVLIMDL